MGMPVPFKLMPTNLVQSRIWIRLFTWSCNFLMPYFYGTVCERSQFEDEVHKQCFQPPYKDGRLRRPFSSLYRSWHGVKENICNCMPTTLLQLVDLWLAEEERPCSSIARATLPSCQSWRFRPGEYAIHNPPVLEIRILSDRGSSGPHR